MTSDTMCTAAIEDWDDPSGSESRCKCGKPSVGYGSLCDDRMNTRQPPYRTENPDTEGQASEETMNEAVRCRGTAFENQILTPLCAMR
jgi:hypothetical protein